MVEFSQGYTLPSPSDLVPLQFKNALAKLFEEPNDTQIPEVKSGVISKTFQDPKMLDSLFMGSHVDYAGQEFENAIPIMDAYIKSTDRFRAIEKDSFSREERKKIYVFQLIHHFGKVLDEILSLQNRQIDDFLQLDGDQLMAFFTIVPSLDIEIELVTERDQHWDRNIERNDIVDISFLSAAIPYCDVVVTEKFWAALIKRKKLNEKYHTTILRNLANLNLA